MTLTMIAIFVVITISSTPLIYMFGSSSVSKTTRPHSNNLLQKKNGSQAAKRHVKHKHLPAADVEAFQASAAFQ